MPPKRKMTVAGPRRVSMRLRARFQGMRSISDDFEPIEVGLSESTPPPSPVVAAQENPEQEQSAAEVQSHNEQEQPMGENNGDESIPEAETPVVAIPEKPYSNPRFANQESEERYTTGYAKRVVLCERGIQLDDYAEHPYELMEMIENRGWLEWVSVSQRAIVPLVKEFYSNAVKGEDGRNEIRTEVRKKPIVLTPEMIAQVGALPLGNIPVATPQQQAEWEGQLSKDNMAKLLTGNSQALWNRARMSRADLTDKSRVLHMLVCSKILPHAYVSTVTVAQAEFIGKLLLDIPIDLTNHIWTTIAAAVEKHDVNAGLPFGGLITKIIQSHGVKGKAGMDMVKPAARIAKTSVKRSQGQLARRAVVEPPGEQQPAREEGAGEVTIQSLYEIVRDVQRKQDEFITEMKNWRAKQEESNEQMIEMLNGLYEPVSPRDFGAAQ